MPLSVGQYVLVTGATGFIGAHVVDNLLSRGIRVRIAARSPSKGESMLAARLPQFAASTTAGSLLDYVTVPDFSAGKKINLSPALEGGIDGIIHVASPFTYDTQNNEAELIIPAINGVKAILSAAAAAAAKTNGQVKRVVITSSFASVIDLERNRIAKEGGSKGEKYFTYTAEDWNPLSYEEAADPSTSAVVAYRGSKKFAELAAWEFVNNNSDKCHGFDIVTLCPPMTFGPVVHGVTKRGQLNESNAMIWKVVKYLKGEEESMPVSRVPFWVDVRDLAEVHVQALIKGEAGGRRYLVSSLERFSYGVVEDIVREEFPELVRREKGPDKPEQAIDESYGMDGVTVARDLGVRYRSFRETVVDLVKQVVVEMEEE
ncbi:hypothetical protein QBC43DRAFT_381229 [Cladorrhinum sp. PSN259]|nr:hypothetical protein QBC43DRAFT_381229 [Cladorrhinum sp. PSN259]